MKTISEIARQFGCTPDQVRAQFAKNADQMAKMAEKARSTTRKVNGYTAEQLYTKAEQAKARSLEQS